jgi:hypothetical protein
MMSGLRFLTVKIIYYKTKNMKKILVAVLLMITSISAFSQQKPILNNQFSDYVQFQKRKQNFTPNNFPMRPKPLSITTRGNKVIVVYRKEDFQKLRPIINNRIMWREKPRNKFQRRFFEQHNH